MTHPKPISETDLSLARQFDALVDMLPGDPAARRAAFATFEKTGLPTRRLESWHYTDWARLTGAALPPLPADASADVADASYIADPLRNLTEINALSVNGALTAHMPFPEGIEFMSFSDGMKAGNPLFDVVGTVFPDSTDPMVALNSAMYTDGLAARIGPGLKFPLPLQAICVIGARKPGALYMRGLLVVEAGAEVTIIDGLVGPEDVETQANTVTEIVVGEGAKVEYVTFNGVGGKTEVFTALGVHLGKNAMFNTLNFALGGRASRHQVHVTAAGEGARLGIRGVSLLSGNQHGDCTLVVDHAAPDCESRELFRTVLDGSATGVFQGRIGVRQAAQRTDGQMASNAILLSDDAAMNNKPELEIFADDVVCAHGATCGALDDDLLFYLQARGLPRAEAEALMVQAFCGEVLEHVSDENLRERLNGIVANWLKARAGA